MDLTEQELAGLSETERAALEAEDGGYDGGARFDGGADDETEAPDASSDDVQQDADTDPADTGSDKGGETSEAASTEANESQSAEAAEEPAAEQAFRPRYVVDLPADFQQQLSGVESDIAALEQKYRDGDVDFDEFRAQERQLIGKREELSSQRVKAEIAAEQSAQASTQEWEWNVKRFFRETNKAEGIDYQNDVKANKALDSFVKTLASDPDNAQRDSEWFLQEAHKRTKLLLGIGKATAQADPASPTQKRATDPAKGRDKAPAPRVAMGDLPQAGETAGDVGGDEFGYLDKLSGIALERALRKLSTEQSERYLTGSR